MFFWRQSKGISPEYVIQFFNSEDVHSEDAARSAPPCTALLALRQNEAFKTFKHFGDSSHSHPSSGKSYCRTLASQGNASSCSKIVAIGSEEGWDQRTGRRLGVAEQRGDDASSDASSYA